jgi:hypothetical protein
MFNCVLVDRLDYLCIYFLIFKKYTAKRGNEGMRKLPKGVSDLVIDYYQVGLSKWQILDRVQKAARGETESSVVDRFVLSSNLGKQVRTFSKTVSKASCSASLQRLYQYAFFGLIVKGIYLLNIILFLLPPPIHIFYFNFLLYCVLYLTLRVISPCSILTTF